MGPDREEGFMSTTLWLLLITQFKAPVFLRAGILVAVGLVLCGINLLVTRRVVTREMPRLLRP
jgi:hypothetical protein